MSRLQWKVAGGLAIGYVLLTLVGVSLGTKVPELGVSSSGVRSDFTGDAMATTFVATYVTGLALLVFLSVAAFVGRALRGSDGATWAASTAFAAGVAFAVTNALDPVMLAASTYAAHHGADAGTLTVINDVRNFVLDAGFMMLGAFAVAAATAILTGHRLPRWVGVFGLISGVLLFVPPAFGPAFLLNLIWTVALGITMIARKAPAAAAEPVSALPVAA